MPYLFLLSGEDHKEGTKKFSKFVKDTGGNLTDDRTFLDQWKELKFDSKQVGVLFTRVSHGTAKVMTAQVVGITRELISETSIKPPWSTRTSLDS